MLLDAHQHFWKYDPVSYPWITGPLQKLQRDFLPADLQPLLDSSGFAGSIVVQARQSLTETYWLLRLADVSPNILGVVGWVDLCSKHVEEQLGTLSGHPKLVGVRHVVQDEPDDHFMQRADFQRGIGILRSFGLTYDVLIYPRQLTAAIDLVRRFPEQPFVLDHMAKPCIRDKVKEPWQNQIRELSQYPNVCCKISGMVTEASWQSWKTDDFRPYLDAVFASFGEERLMFGSDWPVCLLAASYKQVYRILAGYIQGASLHKQEKLLGGNAARFYGIHAPS